YPAVPPPLAKERVKATQLAFPVVYLLLLPRTIPPLRAALPETERVHLREWALPQRRTTPPLSVLFLSAELAAPRAAREELSNYLLSPLNSRQLKSRLS